MVGHGRKWPSQKIRPAASIAKESLRKAKRLGLHLQCPTPWALEVCDATPTEVGRQHRGGLGFKKQGLLAVFLGLRFNGDRRYKASTACIAQLQHNPRQ